MAFSDLYPIKQDWLPLGREHNRPGTPLNPQGMVIHDTDDPGATDENEDDYFDNGYRAASAHTFIDWDSITEVIPENEEAWHAGPTADSLFLGLELCVPPTHDPTKFAEVWKRGVWYTALKFVKHGWETGPGLWSHRGVSNRWRETDHQDPIAFFAEYGKSWDDFVADVNTMIVQLKNEAQGGLTVEKAILIFSQDDLPTAKRLQGKIGNCAIFFRNSDGSAPADVKAAKQLFVVGGAGSVGHPNEVILQGADWFKTADAVAKYLG